MKLKHLRFSTWVSIAWVVGAGYYAAHFISTPAEYKSIISEAGLKVSDKVVELNVPDYEPKYKEAEVELHGSDGKVVSFKLPASGQLQIPVDKIPKGSYNVKAAMTCQSDNPVNPSVKEVHFLQQFSKE